MKKLFAGLCGMCFAVGIHIPAQADVLAQWTFDTLTQTATPGSTPPVNNFAPEVGSGLASGFHASPAAVWSTPAGNLSAKSFSVNNWSAGDYFQFMTSTLGYAGISISYDQTGSSTGPRDFGIAYSTDGSTFTPFGSDYAVLLNGGAPNPSWGVGSGSSAYSMTFDLSSITAIDNAASVYFRIVNGSTVSIGNGVVGPAGTGRVDNFTVNASPVPEPQALSLMVGFGLFAMTWARRRK